MFQCGLEEQLWDIKAVCLKQRDYILWILLFKFLHLLVLSIKIKYFENSTLPEVFFTFWGIITPPPDSDPMYQSFLSTAHTDHIEREVKKRSTTKECTE